MDSDSGFARLAARAWRRRPQGRGLFCLIRVDEVSFTGPTGSLICSGLLPMFRSGDCPLGRRDRLEL